MLERRHEYDKMARVEQEHWWYRTLHHLVLDSIRRRFRGNEIAIIDAGCGTGGLMLFLRSRGYCHISGFDLSEDGVRYCRQRNLAVAQDHLLNLAARHPPASADVIVSTDTLYFLEPNERISFVRQSGEILKPGGLLILNLPALKAFAGIHDLSVGIKHRFSRADVRAFVNRDRFHIVRELYWPFLLSPAVFLVRAFQRLKMRVDSQFDVRSDIELPGRAINMLLETITRLENRWFPTKPFGSSLLVVAEKMS